VSCDLSAGIEACMGAEILRIRAPLAAIRP